MRRTLGLALALGALLVGCDPHPVPQVPAEADIDVHFEPEGELVTAVRTAPRKREEALQLAADVAESLGTRGAIGVHIDPNGGGYEFPVAVADGAFDPGPTVPFRLSTHGLPETLEQHDVESARFSFCAPDVPTEGAFDGDGRGCVYVDDLHEESFAMDVVFRPDVTRYFVGLALAVLVAALTAAAGWLIIRARFGGRVAPGVGLNAIAAAALVAGWSLPWPSAYDHAVLGLDELWGGFVPWAAASVVLTLATFAIPGLFVAATVIAIRRRRAQP